MIIFIIIIFIFIIIMIILIKIRNQAQNEINNFGLSFGRYHKEFISIGLSGLQKHVDF